MLAFNLAPSALMHDALMHDTLDALLAAPLVHSRQLGRCGLVPSPARRRAAASVAEDENAYVVTVEAPGVKADELSVSLEHDVLTIASSSESAHGTFSFKRQAKLPNADAKSATATHEDGVLTITIKKAAAAEPVQITVGTQEDDATDQEDEDEDEDDLSAYGFARASKPYTLTIAAPGVKASDIRVEASQATLSISGRTTSAHGSFSVHRAYKLPRDANVDAATATHVDGILTIKLPTCPAAEATAIEISTAAAVNKQGEKAGATDGAPAEASAAVAGGVQGVPSNEVEAAPKAEKAVPKAEEWLAEWDTLLDDLAEMGFEDRESGRAALAKHSGSIKRAVKELFANRAGM